MKFKINKKYLKKLFNITTNILYYLISTQFKYNTD